MATLITSAILDSAIAVSQQLLTEYALGEDLIDDLTTTFGSSYDGDVAAELIEQWQIGEFGSFPIFEIRSADEINGANGAFSADTNKIYISEEYLLANANNLEAISNLVLEEFGHFVDASINTVDSAGDEGAIFSGLVQGESFTDSELQQLQLENDQAVITLDGEEIAIEQQEASTIALPTDLKIRGNDTHIHTGDFDGDGKDDDIFAQQRGAAAADNNKNTARIFFARSEGEFSKSDSELLPENLKIKGHINNLHVGDFNGDGFDDFLAQQKGSAANNNENTARIFFNDGNGSFNSNDSIVLPEEFAIKGDLTNLHVGDFNGDGRDDFLRQEKGKLDNDNIDTADIFFSNGDGTFSQTDLPEELNIKGDETTLYIGDFNGDGTDDFLRHKKNKSGPDNKIFLLKKEGDGTVDNTLDIEDIFSDAEKQKIGERRFRLTNLLIGDFNGDGVDDFIPQTIRRITTESNRILGVMLDDRTHFLDANNNVSKGRKGALKEAIPLRRFSTEFHQFKLSVGDFNGDGRDDILSNRNNGNQARIKLTQNFDIEGGAGDNILTGGEGKDTLKGGNGDDILFGKGGDDFLDGGNGFNTAQYRGGVDEFILFREQDGSLTVTDVQRNVNGNEGVDSLTHIERLIFGDNSVVDFAFGDVSNDTLTGSSNIDFINGGLGKDLLNGAGNDDQLAGGGDDDILNGGEGNDILEGGAGNDSLDGGTGFDIAAYKGDFDGFKITFKDNGTIEVKDDDATDGSEGLDTLTNIDQLSFGGTRLAGDSQTSTVQAVAGVSLEKATTFIEGGSTNATNFIIDIEGKTGLTLDFNNQQLADFINAITLPDPDIENARLAINLGFEALGGGLGAIPGFGDAAATSIAIQQTLANYLFDLEQVRAQERAAADAVKNFDSLNFFDLEDSIRETVVIEDFQIGVDKLFLPKLEGADGGYSISTKVGTERGVSISAINNGKESELVFIVNGYEEENLSNDDFEALIKNLLRSQKDAGVVLGTFHQHRQIVSASPAGITSHTGTFAGDHLFGSSLTTDSSKEGAGDLVISGRFGDDLLQGGNGSDSLHGGFFDDEGSPDETGERSLKIGIFEYQDDGFDTLQGGLGNDTLFGGRGNDILDGGGFTVKRDPLTGAKLEDSDGNPIVVVQSDDGTDRLVGGEGNDIFIFNTLFTGKDIIVDFTTLDQIRIDGNRFGEDAGKDEVTIEDFKFSDGVLSFNSQEFAELENFNDLQGVNLAFSQNQDTGIITFGITS